MIPAMIIVIASITIVNYLSSKPTDINIAPYFVPIMAAFFGFNFYRSIKKQKKLLYSYTITVSNDGVTREQLNMPPLTISSIEIKEIIKTKKGAFRVKGVDKADVIYIPSWIDNTEGVENALQSLAPITFNPKVPLYRKFAAVLPFIGVCAMICVYALENMAIVCTCAIILVGLLIWAFYTIQTNKNVGPKVKRNGWFFILLIVAVICIVVTKFTGYWPF